MPDESMRSDRGRSEGQNLGDWFNFEPLSALSASFFVYCNVEFGWSCGVWMNLDKAGPRTHDGGVEEADFTPMARLLVEFERAFL